MRRTMMAMMAAAAMGACVYPVPLLGLSDIDLGPGREHEYVFGFKVHVRSSLSGFPADELFHDTHQIFKAVDTQEL